MRAPRDRPSPRRGAVPRCCNPASSSHARRPVHDDDPGASQRGRTRARRGSSPASLRGQPRFSRERLARRARRAARAARRQQDARDVRSARGRSRLPLTRRSALLPGPADGRHGGRLRPGEWSDRSLTYRSQDAKAGGRCGVALQGTSADDWVSKGVRRQVLFLGVIGLLLSERVEPPRERVGDTLLARSTALRPSAPGEVRDPPMGGMWSRTLVLQSTRRAATRPPSVGQNGG